MPLNSDITKNERQAIVVKPISTLYLDESGTRHPDHNPTIPTHGRDWFAVGGLLIDDEDRDLATASVQAFRDQWPQLGASPLHSHEIRGGHKNFAWLKDNEEDKTRFLKDLTALLLALPVLGIACVIDRPGHNARYKEKYTENRWQLCKTAFAITVERAVKRSIQRGRKLRVYVEKSGKVEEAMLKGYYQNLKTGGHWFSPSTAAKYAPTGSDEYKNCLYDFKVKTKNSLLMTIADLYLWPMCIGGYDLSNKAYAALRDAGKLIDCHLSTSDIDAMGIKYSCFENVIKKE